MIEKLIEDVLDNMLLIVDEGCIKSFIEYGSVARNEYNEFTSNINLLCITNNIQSYKKLINNFSEIKYKIESDSKIRVRVFSSYIEDKFTNRQESEAHILLLIREPSYLISKMNSQPFFLLNILKDKKLVFGKDLFTECSLTENIIRKKINISQLIHGEGGLCELNNLIVASSYMMNLDMASLMRICKYAIIRSTQIAHYINTGKVITAHKELLVEFYLQLHEFVDAELCKNFIEIMNAIQEFNDWGKFMDFLKWHDSVKVILEYFRSVICHFSQKRVNGEGLLAN